MRASGVPPFDVGAFLGRVEAAAPIEAVEEFAAALGEWIGARRVAFLIADFSGRAVVRLTSSGPAVDGARSYSEERAETLPLPGSRYEPVLRTQRIVVQPLDEGARLIVPVTDRGDAIGVLELDLPRSAEPGLVADVAAAAHALAYVSSPPGGTPTCSSGVSERPPSRSPRRSSAAC